MSGQKVIYGRLSNNSTITDLLANGKAGIKPMKSAQKDANPRITYYQTGGQETYSHSGDSNLSIQQWQLDAYADDYPALCELVAALKVSVAEGGPLSGYKGSTNTGSVTVQSLFFTNDYAVDEGVIDGTDSKKWRHTFDIEITLEK